MQFMYETPLDVFTVLIYDSINFSAKHIKIWEVSVDDTDFFLKRKFQNSRCCKCVKISLDII